MYKSLIQELMSKGVLFDKGLSKIEVEEIEKRYNIHFPSELLKLYLVALPISFGFYNWRDVSEKNVNRIKHALTRPTNNLKEETSEIDWSDNWGKEPDNEEQREKIILSKVQAAPRVIPVFGHRYMAQIDGSENPVFSIHGADIICYGKNLFTYLQAEFGITKLPQILLNELTYVPFWSDFL